MDTGNARQTRFERFAAWVSTVSMGAVFVVFLIGIISRQAFNHPIGWVDEAVTVLSVWSAFWTAAFVLRWSEFISFDIVFVSAPLAYKRFSLLAILAAFVALMVWSLPGLVDYTLFLRREHTDMLEMRLDFVYAIFPIFILTMVIRLGWSCVRLLRQTWRAELSRWTDMPAEDAV